MPREPKGLTVPDLLNKSQEGGGGHQKYAKLLWSLQQADSDQCWTLLSSAVRHLLCVPEVTVLDGSIFGVAPDQPARRSLTERTMQASSRNAEKVLAFLAAFCGFQAAEREQDAEKFVEDLVWDLLDFVSAVDKVVRTRACQLLTLILGQLPELDEQLSDSIQDTLLARLRDKLPAVRTFAAASVARLADPQEVGQQRGQQIASV